MPLTLNDNRPHETKFMYIDKMIPVQFKLENEWRPTDKDWQGMMDFNKLMFRGDFGGCGKTHMAVELAKKITTEDRIAFVCWRGVWGGYLAKGSESASPPGPMGLWPCLRKVLKAGEFTSVCEHEC